VTKLIDVREVFHDEVLKYEIATRELQAEELKEYLTNIKIDKDGIMAKADAVCEAIRERISGVEVL
jgi:hypothetical protein